MSKSNNVRLERWKHEYYQNINIQFDYQTIDFLIIKKSNKKHKKQRCLIKMIYFT